MRLLAFAVLCCLLLPRSDASASTYERRVYTTAHCGEAAPRIDGRLDDPCWARVPWGDGFTQWEPQEGEPPTQRTAFKILYDEDALYVAWRAYDSEPDKIVSRLARRDWFPGDWVEINIDSRHDLRTAYSFTASVSGTRGDEFVSEDGSNWDSSWDPIWDFRSRRDAQGWTAEARIPLSQLRYGDAEEQVWGIQVTRRLFRHEERSTWQPKSKDESGWVSRFGELRGIRGLGTRRQIELMPYSVAQTERFEQEDGNPFRDGDDHDLSAGLDGKVGVTGNLTLDFTVNPDFGQVEADPSEVNLSAFETFFSEKRPFFIEGRNIFDFHPAPSVAGGDFADDRLFYSRRIGRRPAFSPELDDGEHADVPVNSSILGAAKLSGKTAGGLSVGLLESMTAREAARIDRGGAERKETVEPFTNYLVGRLRQDLREGGTRIGVMGTAVNRRLGDDDHLNFLHESAYSGGVDLFHSWNDRSWYAAVREALSHVRGDQDALVDTQTRSARYYQRPDNDYEDLDSTRTSLTGHAGSFRLGKNAGSGPWRFETGLAWKSPGYETNDLGFQRRADEINQFTWVQYGIRNPFSVFRSFRVNANQWHAFDWGGTRLYRQGNVNFNTTFQNNYQVGAGITRRGEQISNTALRGGPSVASPGETNGDFWINSDGRQRVVYGFGGSLGDGSEDSHDFRNVWADLAVRPTNTLRVSVGPWFTDFRNELQYVGTRSFGAEDRYLFGRLHQKTFAITLRLDYTITPNLTVQYYGSPFVSSGKYTGFARITSPRADRYRDRFQVFDASSVTRGDGTVSVDEDGGGDDYSFDDPDFNFRDFNSNLVLRWEFDPGSVLFLVWNQARSESVDDGRFRLGDDLDGLFGTHPRNIFLVKVSKWFSL